MTRPISMPRYIRGPQYNPKARVELWKIVDRDDGTRGAALLAKFWELSEARKRIDEETYGPGCWVEVM